MNDSQATRSALIVLLRAQRNGMSPAEKAKRKKPVRWLYPWATENHYRRLYQEWVKPVRVFVHEFLEKHQESVLRGDAANAVVRQDAVAGESFALMVRSLNGWVNAYISDDEQKKLRSPIYMGLGDVSQSAFNFNGGQYNKSVKSALGVNFPSDESWWPDARKQWQDTNYEVIRSDIRKYISDINSTTEQAVTNGWSVKMLSEQIMALDIKITKSRAAFIARDQIGKLNGIITQKRMEDIGLTMYEWSSSSDERVRESHALMDGKLCRWDDATVYSEDGGKTWKKRPNGAVLMHPGMDYQCRCCALAWFNELIDEADGVEPGSVGSGEVGYPRPVNSIDDFKKMDTPLSVEDALKQVNPNFSTKGFEWNHNCQRCCPTYEAIRRGYDVVAKPTVAKNDVELLADKFTDYYSNAFSKMFKDADVLSAKGYGKNDIIQSMKDWGDGSRCEICVVWKDWSGHVFMAEQVEGKTIFLDPQSNKVYDESVFKETKMGRTKYFRTDNLDFNDNILECCLNRKEKRK